LQVFNGGFAGTHVSAGIVCVIGVEDLGASTVSQGADAGHIAKAAKFDVEGL
jgi:hypothetical protein